MNRKRGRRSTLREATVKWNALPLEERMRAGQRDLHSTPDFRREQPSGPFAAWARCEPR